jgi:hypothetical protein
MRLFNLQMRIALISVLVVLAAKDIAAASLSASDFKVPSEPKRSLRDCLKCFKFECEKVCAFDRKEASAALKDTTTPTGELALQYLKAKDRQAEARHESIMYSISPFHWPWLPPTLKNHAKYRKMKHKLRDELESRIGAKDTKHIGKAFDYDLNSMELLSRWFDERGDAADAEWVRFCIVKIDLCQVHLNRRSPEAEQQLIDNDALVSSSMRT